MNEKKKAADSPANPTAGYLRAASGMPMIGQLHFRIDYFGGGSDERTKRDGDYISVW